MDAVSVWVEHLRVQAVEAQEGAEDASLIARRLQDAGVKVHSLRQYQRKAWRLGIIAREARRQYQAAVALMADPSWRKMVGVGRNNRRAAPMGAKGMEGVLLGLVGHEP